MYCKRCGDITQLITIVTVVGCGSEEMRSDYTLHYVCNGVCPYVKWSVSVCVMECVRVSFEVYI